MITGDIEAQKIIGDALAPWLLLLIAVGLIYSIVVYFIENGGE